MTRFKQNKACRLVSIPFRQEIIHTGRESIFNFSISHGRLPKIILKISFPQRIHANCRQEVHSYIIKDELYSKLANFCQTNNVETMAANYLESFLAVASHSLALKRNSCINGNRMYPSQNNCLYIQTISIQIHGSQSPIVSQHCSQNKRLQRKSLVLRKLTISVLTII